MLIDVNLRPNLNHKGIVAKNSNGVWNVMCVKRSEINRRGAEMAGGICSMLGFSGYSFYNVTSVTSDGIEVPRNVDRAQISGQHTFLKHLRTHFDQSLRYMRKRHNDPNEFWSDIPSDMRDGIHFSETVGAPKKCSGFYIECVPHAVIPVVIPLPDGIRPPNLPKPTPSKQTHKVKPISPVIQPNGAPTVIVPAVNNTKPETPSSEHINDEHFPWSASIYINGLLVCNGILFDRVWIGVEGSCVTSVK